MKLRFEVNQAEAFRRGINVENSIVLIEVDPKTLPQDQRDLIADRLDGIDVCELETGASSFGEPAHKWIDEDTKRERLAPKHVKASGPTFKELLEAVRADEQRFQQVKAEREAQKKRESGLSAEALEHIAAFPPREVRDVR